MNATFLENTWYSLVVIPHGLVASPLTANCRYIVNDSYRTDVMLMHPPHIVAVAAMLLTAQKESINLRPWLATLNIDTREVWVWLCLPDLVPQHNPILNNHSGVVCRRNAARSVYSMEQNERWGDRIHPNQDWTQVGREAKSTTTIANNKRQARSFTKHHHVIIHPKRLEPIQCRFYSRFWSRRIINNKTTMYSWSHLMAASFSPRAALSPVVHIYP